MNQMTTGAPRTYTLAIWSLILSILSLLCCGIAAIPGIICGHIARSKIKQSAGSETGSGLALAGLIIGYCGIVINLLLVAIAIPNFISYRDKAFCSMVEIEAHNTVSAVSCYLSDAANETVPSIEELAANDDCGFTPSGNVSVEISGTPDNIVVTAWDISGRCPKGSSYVLSIPESNQDGWQE